MATGGELQLLGAWPSPYAARVKIALALKGLEYEYLEQDLQNKSELLLQSNPVHKKVPVLIHGGRPICESLVIVQYIDETWAGVGPSILPTDPYDRALARFWAAYVEEKAIPSGRAIITANGEEATAAALAEAGAVFKVLEEGFKACSGGKAFFGGDEIGYVDIVLGSSLMWLKVFEKIASLNVYNATGTTLLAEWAERFFSHDVASKQLPPIDKLTEFAIRRRQAAAAAAAAEAAAK